MELPDFIYYYFRIFKFKSNPEVCTFFSVSMLVCVWLCRQWHQSGTALWLLTGEDNNTDNLFIMAPVNAWDILGSKWTICPQRRSRRTCPTCASGVFLVCSDQYLWKVVQGSNSSELVTGKWTWSPYWPLSTAKNTYNMRINWTQSNGIRGCGLTNHILECFRRFM